MTAGRPTGARIRPRDERGWLVPRVGTQARLVYEGMLAGIPPRHIAPAIGMSKEFVRITMWRIRHPERYVANQRIYRLPSYRRHDETRRT